MLGEYLPLPRGLQKGRQRAGRLESFQHHGQEPAPGSGKNPLPRELAEARARVPLGARCRLPRRPLLSGPSRQPPTPLPAVTSKLRHP